MFINGYEVVILEGNKMVTILKTSDYRVAVDTHRSIMNTFREIDRHDGEETVIYCRGAEIRPTTLYVPDDEDEEL